MFEKTVKPPAKIMLWGQYWFVEPADYYNRKIHEPNEIRGSAGKTPGSANDKVESGFLAATSFFSGMALHAILERSR